MRVHWIVSAELLLAITGAFAYYYYWPQPLLLPRTPILQSISESNGQTVVYWPGRVFVCKVGEFDNALSAYLMFDYLRSQDLLRGVLVQTSELVVRCDNDGNACAPANPRVVQGATFRS